MRERILLFIPMYNCEKQVGRVLGSLDGEAAQYFNEVIVVNNRSTDSGEAAVQRFLKNYDGPLSIQLLRNRDNYGLGGSHKVAFDYALENGFNYVAVLHGDDQGSIADLLPLLRAKTYQNYDCCLGGRFLKGSKLVGYSRFRTFGNLVFNVIFSLAVGKRIYDLGAGLNLYSVSMLRSRYYVYFPDNLTFNCYMLFALSEYRQKNLFFPITWREEDQISNVKMTRQAWQTLKMAVGYFVFRKRFLDRDAREKPCSSYASEVIYRAGRVVD